MQTICLFGSDYSSSAEVHTALRRLLDLPDYYGMNADALHDCLSERREPVSLYVAHAEHSPAADTLDVIRAVVEDLGGKVTFA